MSQNKFTVEHYMAIASEIDADLFERLMTDMHKLMPKEHANPGTAIYITVRLMTKVICTYCGDDVENRLKAVEDVYQKLTALVKEAKIVEIASDIESKNTN